MTLARRAARPPATRVDEHVDPEDAIAFEDARERRRATTGGDASERSYGSDADYDGGWGRGAFEATRLTHASDAMGPRAGKRMGRDRDRGDPRRRRARG